MSRLIRRKVKIVNSRKDLINCRKEGRCKLISKLTIFVATIKLHFKTF